MASIVCKFMTSLLSIERLKRLRDIGTFVERLSREHSPCLAGQSLYVCSCIALWAP